MPINWQDVITSIGTTVVSATVVVGAVAWVIKTVVSHRLTRDAETFRIRLQADATTEMEAFRIGLQANANTEIERLKNALQVAADERKVTFSKLHEERAQRIADLYQHIVQQSFACQLYVNQLAAVNREERFVELEKKFSELYFFFETSRIYLPERVCTLLEKCISAVREPVIGVFVYSGTNNQAPDAVRQETNRAFIAAVKAFEAEIPAARKVLADEFRKMLGVESSPSPGG